jgi:hypothetical protein
MLDFFREKFIWILRRKSTVKLRPFVMLPLSPG